MFWKKSPRKRLEKLLVDGGTAMNEGDLDGALALFEQLVRDAVAAKDQVLEAAGLQRRGVIKDLRGDAVGAEHDVRAALQLNRSLEGADGPTVRQDLFTLGVILARRGDSLAAEAPFLESARIAGLNDQDAHSRALHYVVAGRLEREDRAGALALLWEVRPGGDGPRWLVGSMDAPMLVQLLLEDGRLDDALSLLPECMTAQSYWSAKRGLGRIDEATMKAMGQATFLVAVVCARGAAAAGRRQAAEDILLLLEHLLGADEVAQLRAELFG
ncbi:hypothetical protein [Nannocystis punicea]|uniref:Tetratricopeptide repeat protein n=1 Tax=Nannocystis punicea TaxID=2995304 RepID=A0ABY7HCC8_9BACT|nr:hypothetical protein [Nannocystis poenicansa]WAS96745.1 hypothetical protein O0S08_11400 [Nannocystis poenicansa]